MTEIKSQHFTSRESLEVFIKQNPIRFLHELERSPDLRNNFQILLQDFNNSDLISIANLMQGKEVRNPINNKLMIVEDKALQFFEWSKEELKQIHENPYHKLSSYSEFVKHKMEQEQELEEKKKQEKLEKLKKYIEENKEKIEMEKTNLSFIIKANHTFTEMVQNMVGGKLTPEIVKNFEKLGVELKNSDIVQEAIKTAPVANLANALKSSMDDKTKAVFGGATDMFAIKVVELAQNAISSKEKMNEMMMVMAKTSLSDRMWSKFNMSPEEFIKKIASGELTPEMAKELSDTVKKHHKDKELSSMFGIDEFKDVAKGNIQPAIRSANESANAILLQQKHAHGLVNINSIQENENYQKYESAMENSLVNQNSIKDKTEEVMKQQQGMKI